MSTIFSIFETLPRWLLLVQNNGNMNFWNMLNMRKNQCTKFGQQKKTQVRREWCCSGVFIVNFRSVGIEDLVEHLQWSFFAIQWTKAKILNWLLSTSLILWADFTLITWLWFGWVTRGFSTSPVSWAHLLKYFKNSFLEKKRNQTIRCLRITWRVL